MKRIAKHFVYPAVAILALALISPVSAGEKDARSKAGSEKVFEANLTGGKEVPARNTQANGTAKLKKVANEDRIEYFVDVRSATDVKAAHLHLGKSGANGPVIAWLFPSSPPERVITGESNGVIARGDLRSADLMGPMKDKSIDDLVREIKNGNVYVNVHTSQNPDGEIRGQLMMDKDGMF